MKIYAKATLEQYGDMFTDSFTKEIEQELDNLTYPSPEQVISHMRDWFEDSPIVGDLRLLHGELYADLLFEASSGAKYTLGRFLFQFTRED